MKQPAVMFLLVCAIGAGGAAGQSVYYQNAVYVCGEIQDAYANLASKEQQLGVRWDSIRARLLDDARHVSSDKDFYLLINRGLAALQDGHLGFRYANGSVRNNILTYPDQVIRSLGLRLIEDKVIIVSCPAHLDILGQRLLSINGTAIDTMLTRLSGIYCLRGDPAANRSQLLVYNRFWDYFDLYVGAFPDSLVLRVTDANRHRNVTLSKGDFDKEQQRISGIRLGLPDENPNFRYSIRENGTALLSIPSFEADISRFREFMAGFARECEEKNVSGVIIDLRYNSGGNESFRDLLGYLTRDTLDITYYRYRLSKSFFEDFPGRLAGERAVRKTAAPGTEAGYSEWLAWQIFPAENQYLTEVPVAVAANENVFSSTGKFLYAVKKHSLAAIIGTDIPVSGHGLGKPRLLPGGRFVFRNCYFESRGIDFELLEQRIIAPDVRTGLTTAALQSGVDAFVAGAERYLKRSGSDPAALKDAHGGYEGH